MIKNNIGARFGLKVIDNNGFVVKEELTGGQMKINGMVFRAKPHEDNKTVKLWLMPINAFTGKLLPPCIPMENPELFKAFSKIEFNQLILVNWMPVKKGESDNVKINEIDRLNLHEPTDDGNVNVPVYILLMNKELDATWLKIWSQRVRPYNQRIHGMN